MYDIKKLMLIPLCLLLILIGLNIYFAFQIKQHEKVINIQGQYIYTIVHTPEIKAVVENYIKNTMTNNK